MSEQNLSSNRQEMNRIVFIEATSSVPNEQPTVLFNTGGGPINYIEIRSQLAGNERVRVVFNNGTDYNLDGIRAGTLLRQLRERGLWTPASEAAAGTGSRVRG